MLPNAPEQQFAILCKHLTTAMERTLRELQINCFWNIDIRVVLQISSLATFRLLQNNI
jgi:hypothetical protein